MTMHLDSKERIAGVPILLVRDALKKCGGSFRQDWLLDKGFPRTLCNALAKRGYIVKATDPKLTDNSGFYWYELTAKGKQLARASGARRIPRAIAEKTVAALKERIDLINTSAEYMMRVSEAVIFGSYTAAWNAGRHRFSVQIREKDRDVCG